MPQYYSRESYDGDALMSIPDKCVQQRGTGAILFTGSCQLHQEDSHERLDLMCNLTRRS